MKHTPNKQNVHQSEKEPFTQKAVDMKGEAILFDLTSVLVTSNV